MKLRVLGALVLAFIVGAAGCGGGNDDRGRDNPPPPADGGTPGDDTDGGTDDDDGGVDGGTDDGGDAGTGDGGDGGTDGDDDAGTGDGGTDGGVDGGTGEQPPITIEFPTLANWRFYGMQHGGPERVYGVTADEGGNVWVAGGEEGLFLLRKDGSRFERFTMAEGLRPYGYMPDGSAPPGDPYLKVISVEGGPAGTVFVGYEGTAPSNGQRDCESNFHKEANPDPSVYKSGDADRVELTSEGIRVVHYDISLGPGVLKQEPYTNGREKICDILRILYDRKTNTVWFGGNHGFARGDADYRGDPTCNGQLHCSGVEEHTHPFTVDADNNLLTDAFYGLAADSLGDVWAGGAIRSTKFKYITYGRDYWRAQADSEGHLAEVGDSNMLDIWPDPVPKFSKSADERRDDVVSGMAVVSGNVWVSSFAHGLAQLDKDTGQPVRYITKPTLQHNTIGAMAGDPDGSLWVGYSWVGGVTRIRNGQAQHFGEAVLGKTLHDSRVYDLEVRSLSGKRHVLVGFFGEPDKNIPGSIGIYDGP